MSAWVQHPCALPEAVRRLWPCSVMRPAQGFTLVELVVILIVVGILAVAVIPRLFGNEFAERGFHDGAKAAIQHARKVAVASRRYVCVTVAANGVALSLDPNLPDNNANAVNCTQAVNLPVAQQGCAAYAVCAPTGVVLGGAAGVVFDPLGRPVNANRIALAGATTFTVTDESNIVVQPDSGWVQ